MLKRRYWLTFTFILLTTSFCISETEGLVRIPIEIFGKSTTTRPSVSLALSGGGARGLAQIGVLKVLEEYDIPVHGIAGSSIGAVIGGLYAAGYTADELDSLAHIIEWDALMQNSPPRKQLFLTQKEERAKYLMQLRFNQWKLDLPSAFSSGQKLSNVITGMIMNARHPFPEDFDTLPVKFRSVSTDLVSGRKIVIKDGFLVEAIRASMAIPLLFSPVEKDGALLVDGGLVQNLPVDEARDLGGDLTIAVDTSSELRDQEELTAAWEIADQATTIMQQERTQSQLEAADIQIQPDLAGISNTDFSDIEGCIHSGEIAARQKIKDILQQNTYKDTVYYIQDILLNGRELSEANQQQLLTKSLMDTIISHSHLQNFIGMLCKEQNLYTKEVFLDTMNHQLHVIFEDNLKIEKVEIKGNTIIKDSLLLGKIQKQLPISCQNVKWQNLLDSMIKKYRQHGYSLCKIDTIRYINGCAMIMIDEGKIDRIQVTGRKQTKKFVVTREMGSRTGQLFKADRVQEDIDNIYSTGYFEAVGFQVIPEGRQNLLRMNVIEQGTLLMRSGIRFDNERYVKGFMQITEENFFGLGAKVYLLGMAGRKDNMAEACIRSDRFFNTMFTYNASASYSQNRHHYYGDYQDLGQYLDERTTFSYTIGQQMQRFGTVSVKLTSEHIHLKPYKDTPWPLESESWLLRNITIQSEVDTRDKLPFPQKGNYHLFSYETGGPVLGGEKSYSKIYSLIEFYSPLGKTVNFHNKIAWGNADHGTPFPKQFALGGLNAFGGLRENMLIGKRFIIVSEELRFQLKCIDWLEMYLIARYEFGGLWNDYEKIKSEDFLQTGTLSCAIQTPLGPLIFAWGKTSTDHEQFYFSAGYDF